MKGKFIPFILGGVVGSVVGIIYKDKILKKFKVDYSVSRTYTDCVVLTSYGNYIAVLIEDQRYDLLLERSANKDLKMTDVVVLVEDGDIKDILNCAEINVVSWSLNSLQAEKVYVLLAKDISETGMTIEYKDRYYNLLLDTVGIDHMGQKEFEEGVLSVVDVLIVDSEDVFDILRVNNVDVVDWEEVTENE